MLCITELHVGGAENAFVAVATRLDRERFAPSVVVLGPRTPRDETLAAKLESASIPVTFLGIRRWWQAPILLSRLVTEIRRNRPDVVLPFLFHANIAARFASRIAGVPVCLAGIRVAERQHHWHVTLDRITQSLVHKYVCVSDDVAKFVATHHRISAEKIVVIPNGIAIPTIQTTQANQLHRAIVIGRLHHQKGIDWLLASATRWLARLTNWELVIVGDGPERASLQRQVENAAFDTIRQRVQFLGWRSDAASLLAASDLLLLPSRWEGMPNVVLEAMAAGKPVLAADVEGVCELLGENVDSQIFPPEDDAAFELALEKIASDAGYAARLGYANRARAITHFSIDRIVAEYEMLLYRAPPLT
ncbi:MAG: glycosyltransferase [Thermoguttaceae bacterium]